NQPKIDSNEIYALPRFYPGFMALLKTELLIRFFLGYLETLWVARKFACGSHLRFI
ncbi:hypothetical protein Y032_1485g3893, partial [Ancylostoma ceylanicum]